MPRDELERIRADLESVLGRHIFGVEPIPEGRSGLTYRVSVEGETRCVLRLPPHGVRATGAADVARHARVMNALHAAGLPVPAVVAASESAVVDGRPFHLVEELPGIRVEHLDPARRDGAVAGAALDCLSQIQALAAADTGVGDETPATVRDELDRWSRLAERVPREFADQSRLLAGRLAEAPPPDRVPVLVHGDYHYGNMLFTERGQLIAVVDWELAALGSPLVDRSGLRLAAIVTAQGRHIPPGGFSVHASPEAMLALAAEPTVGTDEADWHLALAYLKYAAIYGYALTLHLSGKRPSAAAIDRRDTIADYLEAGMELVA